MQGKVVFNHLAITINHQNTPLNSHFNKIAREQNLPLIHITRPKPRWKLQHLTE